MLQFGIPRTTIRKVEKYPNFGVLTLLEDEGKGTSKKFELNKFAAEEFGHTTESEVFGTIGIIESTNELFIINCTDFVDDIPKTDSFKFNKNNAGFSNAKVYSFVKDFFDISEESTEKVELLLTKVSEEGYTIFKLSIITESNVNTPVSIQAETELINDSEEQQAELDSLQGEAEYEAQQAEQAAYSEQMNAEADQANQPAF